MRISSPKAFLEVGGVPIIKRELEALCPLFAQVLIISNDPGTYEGLGPAVLHDDIRFREMRSPMTGLYTGLSRSLNNFVFAVACDMPFIKPGLVEWMAALREGHDLVVPKIGRYTEPLFGFYGKKALPVMEKALISGKRSVQDIVRLLDVRYVGEDEMRAFDPELISFTNVNTPEELIKAERMVSGHGSPVSGDRLMQKSKGQDR